MWGVSAVSLVFFFSSRRRHTRSDRDWSSDVCSSDLAFFGSLGLAMIGAVLLDRVDPRVRYPYQVSREMGLTILGAVPHLRLTGVSGRSEERRVGEEGRSRWSPDH